jgi:hypothetical protein
MTYNEWCDKERARDTHFAAWRKTSEGKTKVACVLARYPRLKKTSLEEAKHVAWFFREMCTLGSRLRTIIEQAQRDAYN